MMIKKLLPIFTGLFLLAIACALWMDKLAGEFAVQLRQAHFWNTLRQILAPLGSGAYQGIVILLALLLSFCFCHRFAIKINSRLFLIFVIGVLLTTALKYTFLRPRPNVPREPLPAYSERLHASDWHSFPSGDVTLTVALTAFLYITFKCKASIIFIWIWPVLVSMQRFIAARHYPSDICTGWLLGLLIALIILRYLPINPISRERQIADDQS